MIHAHRMPHGAELQPGGGVRFRLWAPGCHVVQVEFDNPGAEAAAQRVPMTQETGGWHAVVTSLAGPGTRYRFVLPDGLRVPDPASRFQPADVHGPSEVIDPGAYVWQRGWSGRPWHEAIIYELHVGTFTSGGTFRAAIERLDHVAALGATAIELMPIADFPGRRNWGYDGVLLYAPDSSYGRPEDLKALVQAAHSRGLMVLLDVVYNHFGPDGNYLSAYAPAFFTDRHHTPWGAAVNYDGPLGRAVRDFVIHNALYWIEEYQLDGLRLDAVHQLIDDSDRHLLDELSERLTAGRRPIHLILENEENEARRLTRDSTGRPRHFTAQWNDDLHHVLHVAATGEAEGYYADYHGDSLKLARALSEGFAYQGELMEFRGRPRGEASAGLPPTAFVAFIQNHDQIGNRARGDRLSAVASPAALRAVAAIYLLLPQVPMLFMGEEWAAGQPFPFFCDFSGELADAVRRGRREEFARFAEFREESARRQIPDPLAESTFLAAKLDWRDLSTPEHAAWHQWYRRLLAMRHQSIIPLLPLIPGHAAKAEVRGSGAVVVRWTAQNSSVLCLAANLSEHEIDGFPPPSSRVLWQEGTSSAGGRVSPWYVNWSVSEPRGRI